LFKALSLLLLKVKAPDGDELPFILSAIGSLIIKWWADASFAVQNNMQSQTGATISMGCGGIYNMALGSRSSTLQAPL
jgi:hypothetical protein